MTTAKDIIYAALCRMGSYAPGETMSDADAEWGLQELNRMQDSWSNEKLNCYCTLEQSFSCVVGQQYYTVGPGGNINGTRPLKINSSPGSAYLMDANNYSYALEVVEKNQWNLIGARITTSNIPDTLYYNPQYPLGIIGLFPVPTISYTVYFDSLLQLVDFAALSSLMILPPGYEAALVDNLLIRLWPSFKPEGSSPSDTLIRDASESKAAIKRTNMRPPLANYDPELQSRAYGTYDVYSDSNRGRS